ncbi:MAG: NAD(P)H-dependent oxidoreductase [Phenylobacterium sp.]|uniref:NAD(P)H-dependent oxidoreductase n=1 Tax=Phenylobacterium sp. TaxID=1871053 RepID=UPI003918F9FE
MVDRILVINGHPDARSERLCSALAEAYVRGAHRAGHEVRRLDVGRLDFPLIRSQEDFMGPAPPVIAEAQTALKWANHLVIIFPLWIGGPPGLLKGFLEQVFRYGVALSSASGQGPQGLLKGKSARIVVTMGMPAAAFRLIFGGYGLKSLTRGLLWISGIKPIHSTVIGGVETASEQTRAGWLRRLEALGAVAG